MDSLVSHFLVSSAGIKDPFYNRAVVFVFDQPQGHVAGVVMNKPSDSSLADVYEYTFRTDAPFNPKDYPIYMGCGPDDQKGTHRDALVLLHPAGYTAAHTYPVSPNVSLTHLTPSVLNDFGSHENPKPALCVCGGILWEEAALRKELTTGLWGLLPYNDALMFKVSRESMWNIAYQGVLANLDKGAPVATVSRRSSNSRLLAQTRN